MDHIEPITQEEENKRKVRKFAFAVDSINRISINEHIAHKENSSTPLIGDIHACINCYQTISNPMCERCYFKHIKLWLNENVSDSALRKKIMGKIYQRVTSESLSEVKCIICGNESVSLCTYCFFFMTENILTKFDVSKRLITSYSQTFNYQIYHIKYF